MILLQIRTNLFFPLNIIHVRGTKTSNCIYNLLLLPRLPLHLACIGDNTHDLTTDTNLHAIQYHHCHGVILLHVVCIHQCAVGREIHHSVFILCVVALEEGRTRRKGRPMETKQWTSDNTQTSCIPSPVSKSIQKCDLGIFWSLSVICTLLEQISFGLQSIAR